MSKFIYFDNAATTFPKPKIIYKEIEEYCSSFEVSPHRHQAKEMKSHFNKQR